MEILKDASSRITNKLAILSLRNINNSNKKYPIADGSFIQDDMVEKWNDLKWQSEFNYLKEVNMHYVIMKTSYGYEVYRNKKLIFTTNVQRIFTGKKGEKEELVMSYIDKVTLEDKLKELNYEVRAIDFAGNISKPKKAKVSEK